MCKKLKIQPENINTKPVTTPDRVATIVTKFVCDEHGLDSISGMPFEESKKYY